MSEGLDPKMLAMSSEERRKYREAEELRLKKYREDYLKNHPRKANKE
jgi:hypothetical protein